MIWLTWRQHRAVLLVSAGVVAAFAVWMLLVQHDYSQASHAIARSCTSGQLYSQNSPCTALYSRQTSAWEQGDIIRWLLLALPVLFGVLLGAPLFAGEFERKTVLLAFTQSISRTRWMVIRWLLIGLAAVALASALAVLSNWWFGQVPTNGSGVGSRIQPQGFDVTGIVPAAYALFGFALGAALGMVLRRTARAIFGTVVLFATARLLFEHYARPNLAAQGFLPESANGGATLVSGNSWYLSTTYRARDLPGTDHSISQAYINDVIRMCQSNQPFLNWNECLDRHGLQLGTYFQPSSHYWILQWGEAAAFTAAAIALFGIALWEVRRWRA